ncbi:MAG: PspA/IM30 family protein [Schleiferiaceae bacterium]|nr:PspA/IM30 family protein [Schleiferiaceae bacterium]
MNVFKRLFKIGQAETHAAVDKLEDPIKMIEQGLRDLREDQDKAMRALAEVKAMLIRRTREFNAAKERESDLQEKSILLLKRAQNKDIEQSEADTLVRENLRLKGQVTKEIALAESDVANLEKQVQTLESNVAKIKNNIGQWENELRTLKARVKVSSATKMINKQMTGMDSTSVISMLERMKDKVSQEEALADAYGELADANTGHEERMNKKIEELSIDDELEKLKAQLGVNKSAE